LPLPYSPAPAARGPRRSASSTSTVTSASVRDAIVDCAIDVEQRDLARLAREQRAAARAELRRGEPRRREHRQQPADQRRIRVHAARDDVGRQRHAFLHRQQGEHVNGKREAAAGIHSTLTRRRRATRRLNM